MSQILNRLEEFNLITRTPSATDKRKVAISLSDFGKERVEITRNERDEWLKTALENHFSDAERKTLEHAIVLLDRLAEIK